MPVKTAKPAARDKVRRLTLEVDGQPYVVVRTVPSPGEADRLRLSKPGNNPAHYYPSLGEDGVVRCTCPDFLHRHAAAKTLCKHGEACRDLGLFAPERGEELAELARMEERRPYYGWGEETFVAAGVPIGAY